MQEKDVIFISWSGKETASYRMANVLYETMPLVFQSTECFMSDDIDKGSVGINEILKNLAKAKIGIICVTKANIEKTWLNFEAGALTAAVFNKDGKAIPLLIDMTTDEFAAANSPICNLQGTTIDEADLLKMFTSINTNLGNPLKEQQIIQLFNNMVKNQILECDTSSPIAPEQPRNQSSISDVSMTKDCKKFFKSLYYEYSKKKKEGISRQKAATFSSSKALSELFNIPFDDVNSYSYELQELGFLKCFSADDMVYFSNLTSNGIKYCEDNFDEPEYIQLLREIVNEYNLYKTPITSAKIKNYSTYSSDSMSILKSKGFINVKQYSYEIFSVKPTDVGITEIALRDK